MGPTTAVKPLLAAGALALLAGCSAPAPGGTDADLARLDDCLALIYGSESDPVARALRPLRCGEHEPAAVARHFRLSEDADAAQADATADEALTTPTAATLVRNFERTAFRKETELLAAATDENTAPIALMRFADPVRYVVTAHAGDRALDRALDRELEVLAPRLARLTGLDIAAAPQGGRLNLAFVSVKWSDRRSFADYMANSGEREATLDAWVGSLASPCLGTLRVDADGVILFALVVIAAETGPILRRSCVHEVTAQMLGLLGDHPDARPSVFNDDGEFVYLTRQDELLLRMLYDPRLKPGMPWEEAEPIARRIAQDLLGPG